MTWQYVTDCVDVAGDVAGRADVATGLMDGGAWAAVQKLGEF